MKGVRNTLLAALCGLLLLGAASAYALHLRAGNLVVDGDGSFAPTTLPQHRMAPIRVSFHGSIGTLDGSRPSPLRTLVLEIDRHAAPDTVGLPKCSTARLEATTTKQARKLCPGSIIGTGFGTVVVELPEQGPIESSSALTIFNGPERHGNPTAIGHAHIDYPGPTTYLVEAEIEKINRGRYGYRIAIDFPKIVNDYGSPIYGRVTIDRKWKYRGKTHSIANASCPDGHLEAKAKATFKDGTLLQGAVAKPCKILR